MFPSSTLSTTFDLRLHAAGRRRVALAVCALGATLVNAAALVATDSVSSSRLAPSTNLTISPNRALLLLPPREAQQDALASAQSLAAPLPDDRPAVPPIVRDAPLAWAKGTEERIARDQPIRFYRLTEVDTPAAPQTDWAIEPASLEGLGMERLAFEVLINARGEIVGCTIIDPPALGDDIRNELEGKLRDTRMDPAMRGGQPVASVRRIELFLTAEGQ